MEKEKLFETLVRWNYWGKRSFENFRPRHVLDNILPYIDEPFPVVLIGIRRSGKSSLLSLTMRRLIDRGVSPEQLLLINFEEPLFSSHLSIEFLEQLIAVYREKINPDKKIFFFLDEIQNFPDWEKWVRREADLKEHKIFLTGSSARLLSSEISSLLTGRHYSFMVTPLSFREFLEWQNIPNDSEIEIIENTSLIRNSFVEYLKWGGFPETILLDSDEKKHKILHQYFDDILFRDIVLRYQIRDVKLLQTIAEYYMTNLSSLHSFNRIKNIFTTSLDNVRRYSTFLEESQLIFFLNKFSFKLSEQQRSSRKGYVSDTGIRNAISFTFTQDIGKLVENCVANQLKFSAADLFYFGNGSECDFIVKQSGKFFPIQITYSNLSDTKLRNREYQGLISAMKYMNQTTGLLLTDDQEKEERIENFCIQIKPVWKFLLKSDKLNLT
ncbi:ATP-binding protein [candidate division KSB1 bacterium]|nr:ATP-binding protein [candidate division KSB1 bacterium]